MYQHRRLIIRLRISIQRVFFVFFLSPLFLLLLVILFLLHPMLLVVLANFASSTHNFPTELAFQDLDLIIMLPLLLWAFLNDGLDTA